MKNSKQLREERAEVLQQLEAIVNKAKGEKRSLTTDEVSVFDRLDNAAKELVEQAEGLERIEKFEGLTLQEARADIRQAQKPRDIYCSTEERNKGYLGWFLHGSKMQRREYWQAAERQGIDVSNNNLSFKWDRKSEQRQQFTNPGSAGGDVVAIDNQLMSQIDIALKAYGGMREVSTVVRTSTGANLPWPTTDDVNNLAEQSAEGGGINEVDMTFGQNVLMSYRYDTNFMKVSWELLEDSVINLPELIGKQGGIRLGRKLNADFTTGSGASSPTGIVTSATSGATSAANNALVYDDLLTLYHSVDPAYRDQPGCAWMFSDNILFNLRSIVDDNGRPLLMSSLEGISSMPGNGTLLGKRYVINQQMASLAASAKVILFGDFSKYIIRDVDGADGGFNLLRLNERFADKGLVAFLGWSRHDGLLSDAGQHPIKFLQMHS